MTPLEQAPDQFNFINFQKLDPMVSLVESLMLQNCSVSATLFLTECQGLYYLTSK